MGIIWFGEKTSYGSAKEKLKLFWQRAQCAKRSALKKRKQSLSEGKTLFFPNSPWDVSGDETMRSLRAVGEICSLRDRDGAERRMRNRNFWPNSYKFMDDDVRVARIIRGRDEETPEYLFLSFLLST